MITAEYSNSIKLMLLRLPLHNIGTLPPVHDPFKRPSCIELFYRFWCNSICGILISLIFLCMRLIHFNSFRLTLLKDSVNFTWIFWAPWQVLTGLHILLAMNLSPNHITEPWIRRVMRKWNTQFRWQQLIGIPVFSKNIRWYFAYYFGLDVRLLMLETHCCKANGITATLHRIINNFSL